MRDKSRPDDIEAWYYGELFEKPSDRGTGVLHVSDLAYLPGKNPCFMRVLGYWIRGAQPYNNWHFRNWQNFQIGHAIHDRLQAQHLALRPDDFRAEVPVSLEYLSIAGTADGVDEELGIVYEFKSSSDGSVQESFIRQASFYAFLLKQPDILIEVQHKTGALRRHLVPRDRKAIESMLEVAAAVIDRAGHELDKVSRPKAGHQCSMCPFRQVCQPAVDVRDNRFVTKLSG